MQEATPSRSRVKKRNACGVACVFWLCCFFLSFSAYAQIPGSLVPGRQRQEQLEPPKAIPPSVIPGRLVNEQMPPENGQAIVFVLKDIHVTGNETISDKTLSKFWSDYRGKEISILKIYEIANAITKHYADAGYALSFAFVPAQEIDDGVLIIRVVEGFVDKVTFTNGQDVISPPRVLQGLARRISQSRPLKTADLERYMLLMNDQPGYVAQAVFVPSKTENASDLVVSLQHRDAAASLAFDNHLAKTLGRWHGSASATAYGFVTGTDSLQIEQGCGQWCNVYSQLGMQWGTALNDRGTRLGLGLSQSMEAPVEGALVPLDFHGRSQSLSLNISHPLIRSRQTNTDIGASFNWIDSQTKTFAGLLTRDRVRAASVYTRFDYGDSTGAVSQIRISATQGLPALAATGDMDPLRSRAGGSSDFLVGNIHASRYQPLDRLLPELKDFSIMASTSLQQALSDPLLSVSQCYYGGNDFGRGYENGALSGDSCAMASLEFRRNVRVTDAHMIQLYAFGDAGTVRRKGALAIGEKKSEQAGSLGVGARMLIGNNIQGDVQFGWPLNEEATSNGKAAPRSLMSMSVQF